MDVDIQNYIFQHIAWIWRVHGGRLRLTHVSQGDNMYNEWSYCAIVIFEKLKIVNVSFVTR